MDYRSARSTLIRLLDKEFAKRGEVSGVIDVRLAEASKELPKVAVKVTHIRFEFYG